ncbi:MAG: aromatic ring-hydroxylating dioxygenase subunit alpha [Oscillatoriales cyanobacterium SM2_1_8]|nr:aromatic ring-hydroxylating dioxygenase subunit alpha [Oscillatoriales cyanobacterium SM2_1_8]
MGAAEPLRDVWYYVLPSARLPAGTAHRQMILGEPVLVGRDRQGQAFALRDVCPHRGVPLSCGRFDGEAIACGYHGWRFDAQGVCREIPALPEDARWDVSKIRVPTYPLHEQGGNLWIYMPGPGFSGAPLLPPPPTPWGMPQLYEGMVFPCPVDHAVIGLMDPAHGPFVHRVWWWRSPGQLNEKAKDFVPIPYGFAMTRHRLQRVSLGYRLLGRHPEVEITFQLPGIRVETVFTESHRLVNLTAITPLSDTETQIHTVFYWTVPWLGWAGVWLRPFVREFLAQDRRLAVKQQEGLRFLPHLMLVDDADAQARWYLQLKSEYRRALQENRPFANPVLPKTLRWRS